MAVSSSNVTTLHADQEHDAIRYLVLVVLLIGFCLGFTLVGGLLRLLLAGSEWYDYSTVLACLGALPVGIGLTALAEYYLKRVWPSGRSLQIDEGGVTLKRPNTDDRLIEWDKRFNVLRWTFGLKGYPRGGKERRVPASWLCLGLQLHQDETKMLLFTFMPPKKAERILEKYNFNVLDPSDIYGNSWREKLSMPSRPEIPSSVIAGRDGRYWLAERNRWYDGLELTAADFETLLERIGEREARSEERDV